MEDQLGSSDYILFNKSLAKRSHVRNAVDRIGISLRGVIAAAAIVDDVLLGLKLFVFSI